MPPLPHATVKPGYRPQAEDTSIDADVLMFALLRQLNPIQKAERVIRLDRSIRELSPLKQMVEDPITLAKAIAAILEPLNISYYVGGSLASSLLGEPRYSEDLDLIIAVSVAQSKSLIQALEPQFYISEVAVEDALNDRCSSFNIIRLESGEKIDLFISGTDDFSLSKMQRRVNYPLPDDTSLWLCSAEDIILQKLVWRRSSQSEKQWRDVLGVLKVQAAHLDYGYLTTWAERLAIADALSQAFIEAGI
jgi:hypothetical protein